MAFLNTDIGSDIKEKDRGSLEPGCVACPGIVVDVEGTASSDYGNRLNPFTPGRSFVPKSDSQRRGGSRECTTRSAWLVEQIRPQSESTPLRQSDDGTFSFAKGSSAKAWSEAGPRATHRFTDRKRAGREAR